MSGPPDHLQAGDLQGIAPEIRDLLRRQLDVLTEIRVQSAAHFQKSEDYLTRALALQELGVKPKEPNWERSRIVAMVLLVLLGICVYALLTWQQASSIFPARR